jgi:hypothetical protein
MVVNLLDGSAEVYAVDLVVRHEHEGPGWGWLSSAV